MPFKRFLTIALLAIAAVAVHLVANAVGKEYCLTQLTMSLYYAAVVMGLCLVMGYAGQISLGHGGFFAIGGYTAAVLTTHDFSRFQETAWMNRLEGLGLFVEKTDLYGLQVLNATPWVAFLSAMVLTIIVAYLIGFPALRLKGHYLAMATLGFGLIVQKIVLGTDFLGAADGITGVPEWNLLPGITVSGKRDVRVENYYLACCFVLVLLVLLENLIRSRVGRALQAIHERETAANALGIDTAGYKLKTFVLSAVLAAMAGVLFTHYTGGIGPSEAGAFKSIRYVALAAAGGMANIWGAVLVSTGINFLSLRDWFGSYDHAVFGVILIVIISVAPQGPLKLIESLMGRSKNSMDGEGEQ